MDGYGHVVRDEAKHGAGYDDNTVARYRVGRGTENETVRDRNASENGPGDLAGNRVDLWMGLLRVMRVGLRMELELGLDRGRTWG